MKKLKINDVKQYVQENIGDFHKAKLDGLDKLKLASILSRKNPYLEQKPEHAHLRDHRAQSDRCTYLIQ